MGTGPIILGIAAILALFTLPQQKLPAQSDTGSQSIPKTVFITEYKSAKHGNGEDKYVLFLVDPIKMVSMYNATLIIPTDIGESTSFYGGGFMVGTGLIEGMKGFGFQAVGRLHLSKGMQGWFGEIGVQHFSGEKENDDEFEIQLVNGAAGYMYPIGHMFMIEASVGFDYIIGATNDAPLFSAFTFKGGASEAEGSVVLAGGLSIGLRL